MRFLYIKNEQVCSYSGCGCIIAHGEEAVLIRMVLPGGYYKLCFFHTDRCFQDWSNQSFNERLVKWRQSATIRPKKKYKKKAKIGRPIKYSKPVIARRLKALLWYHSKTGDGDRVLELETQIEALKY